MGRMIRGVFRPLIVSTFAMVTLVFVMPSYSATPPDVTRMWFTPSVVPENYAQPVRFEATVSNNPITVGFQYGGAGADRPMYDDGTHGDLVAGDGTWTITFQPSEILSRLTPAQVYRPFIGFCKPAGGGAFNVFAEVWTSSIGLVNTQTLYDGAQRTDYIVNLVVPRNALISFNAFIWAQQFYGIYGDNFDFLNFVLVGGARGNRYHVQVKNSVAGIGTSTFDNSANYGSNGRLTGYSVFPLSNLFDAGETGFNHETGHQWINFLQGTPFASGIPHWPKGDIAINTMGFSIGGQGGQGGTYSFTFTSNGQGGYVTGAGDPVNVTQFNSMELYLMGLIPPSDVGTYFVLKDQSRNLVVGDTLQSGDVTSVTVGDVIAAVGPRSPDSTTSPKAFHSATIVISEQLLDGYAMSFYDWFARRAEATQPLACSSGFSQSTCRPFGLATGGRATMVTKLVVTNPPRSLTSFDGDDKSDIVWQNTDGSAAIWLMNGLSVINGAGLIGPGTGWSVVQVGDFNGDGKSDIVWQNTDGSAAIWLMNGLSVISGAGLIGPGTGWSVKQVGDFNGDGKSDIMWQHTDGSHSIWLMNGLSVISGDGLIGPGTGWSVTQIGDFNGDGKSDVVWQNTDGSASIWLMNGVSALSGGGLIGPGTGWSVKQVGDFNGDGKSDVVWQHTDGSAAIWLMNGLSVINGGSLIGPGTGWSVRAIGDSNGDGKSDIVWQNTDGSAAIWLMNGVSALSGGGLIGPGTGWSVKRLGDYNGDGRSDIVWQNADGSSSIWLMNGTGAIGGSGLLGPGTGWSPAP